MRDSYDGCFSKMRWKSSVAMVLYNVRSDWVCLSKVLGIKSFLTGWLMFFFL